MTEKFFAKKNSSNFGKLSFGINNILQQQQQENCHEQQQQQNANNDNNNFNYGKLDLAKHGEENAKLLKEYCHNSSLLDVNDGGDMANSYEGKTDILFGCQNKMADTTTNLTNARTAAQWRRAAALIAMAAATTSNNINLPQQQQQFYGNNKNSEQQQHLNGGMAKIMSEKRIGHPYQSRMPARNKKPRTSFSKSQVGILETRFLGQKYLASADRQILAAELCMSDAQVKTWFQNRRTKWRRQENEEREFEGKTVAKIFSLASNFMFYNNNNNINTTTIFNNNNNINTNNNDNDDDDSLNT